VDWSRLLDFALLGLGPGALIAGIALAVVLTYRGSGIINLATGAVAMVAGYAFWSLKNGSYGVHFSTAPALVLTAFAVVATRRPDRAGRLPAVTDRSAPRQARLVARHPPRRAGGRRPRLRHGRAPRAVGAAG